MIDPHGGRPQVPGRAAPWPVPGAAQAPVQSGRWPSDRQNGCPAGSGDSWADLAGCPLLRPSAWKWTQSCFLGPPQPQKGNTDIFANKGRWRLKQLIRKKCDWICTPHWRSRSPTDSKKEKCFLLREVNIAWLLQTHLMDRSLWYHCKMLSMCFRFGFRIGTFLALFTKRKKIFYNENWPPYGTNADELLA